VHKAHVLFCTVNYRRTREQRELNSRKFINNNSNNDNFLTRNFPKLQYCTLHVHNIPTYTFGRLYDKRLVRGGDRKEEMEGTERCGGGQSEEGEISEGEEEREETEWCG